MPLSDFSSSETYTFRLDDATTQELARKWKIVMGDSEMILTPNVLEPTKVIFANPSTIVYWNDGTKTVVTCRDNVGQRVDPRSKGGKRFYRTERALPSENYDKTLGLALCYMKRMNGNGGSYNNIFRKFGAW